MHTINPKISATLALASLISNLFFSQSDYNQIDSIELKTQLEPIDQLVTIRGQALVQAANPDTPVVVARQWIIVTGYSSTPDQTDSTPFITASGTYVRDGVVACNFLRFGTRVRFPELYGDKTFVVEDRMALKNSHKIDIWFPSRWEAKQFGVKQLKVEVLET
jgi:3D (Asp-Asp-Asp) domain-containing protein